MDRRDLLYQAMISSPAIPPRRNPLEQQKSLFQIILNAANCSSLGCLRTVSEETIKQINDFTINVLPSDAGGGLFGPAPGFGPVPDGKFIADAPEILFRKGKYHKSLRSLIVGSMANEV
jgi:hypothetical protein